MALIVTICIAAIGFLFFLRWSAKGFAFLLFALPFSVALNPIPGIDLVLLRVLAPVFWLAVLLKEPKAFLRALKAPASLALLLFCIIVSLSLFFATELSWSLRKILYLWSLAPLLPAIAALLHSKEGVWAGAQKAFIAGGILASIIGIAQFLSQFFFGTDALFRFFSGLGPILYGNNLGALVAQYPSWFVNIGGTDYLRAFAFFPDPHIFAFYLLFVSSLLLSLLLEAQKRKSFILFACGYAIVVACFLLTFSRGGYLGLLASFICIRVLGQKQRRMAPVLAIAMGVTLMGLFFGAPVIGRFASSFDVAEGSNAGRLAIWQDAGEKAVQRPLGVGIGNYPATEPGADFRSPITAHNVYLDVLVETGFFGLAAFVLFLATTFFGLIRRFKGSEWASGAVAIGFFAALAGVSVHAFFEDPLWAPAIFVLLMCAAAHASSSRQ